MAPSLRDEERERHVFVVRAPHPRRCAPRRHYIIVNSNPSSSLPPPPSFWQFEKYGVVPDIVTMGKPMGNGYPIGGVAVRREVAEAFANSGIEYFNTYGGNSVACAIGEAVLDAISSDGLQTNANNVGSYLKSKLKNFMAKNSEVVGDVRGYGLFLGVEFIAKESTEEEIIPNADLCKFVVDYLKNNRIITSRDGPDGNVLKLKPPLTFTEKDCDTLMAGIEAALREAKGF